jgi:hypothetical protein
MLNRRKGRNNLAITTMQEAIPSMSALRLGRLSNRTYSSQCFIDRLLPIGHRVPLTRHFAISGLDMRISHPGCGTFAFVGLLPTHIRTTLQ